jgi:hypothetical protein
MACSLLNVNETLSFEVRERAQVVMRSGGGTLLLAAEQGSSGTGWSGIQADFDVALKKSRSLQAGLGLL